MSEEATLEMEALSSIMGADLWLEPDSPSSFLLCVAPEHEAESEVTGAVALHVHMPAGYPAEAQPSIIPCRLSEKVSCFPHMQMSQSAVHSVFWEDADLEKVQQITKDALAGREGETVVYDIIEAVRAFLASHTIRARPPRSGSLEGPSGTKSDGLSAHMAGADVSDDDYSLDEEDMDEEMIEAIREIDSISPEIRSSLDTAEKLKGARQRKALHAIWKQMTLAQRKEMVADSDGSSYNSEDNSSDEDSDELPTAHTGSTRGGGSQSHSSVGNKSGTKVMACPGPAKRGCPRGHTLTAVNAKPNDYKKLDGNTGVCDICRADFKYSSGGYHCATCRNWDCCVACGNDPASQGSSNGGGRGSAGNKRSRKQKR